MPPLHYFFIILWRPQGLFLRIRIVIFVCQSIRAGDHIVSVKNTENVVSFFGSCFRRSADGVIYIRNLFPRCRIGHRRKSTETVIQIEECRIFIAIVAFFYNSVKIACVFLYPEIFADISRRAIKPRLYNIKEKKTVIRHSFRRQPFSAVLQIMYRTFPIRAYADRENTVRLPTERIRQKQRCRKRFSAACDIKSFNSLSCRRGFGGIKGEKERFVFERFFVGTERRKPFFSLSHIYG